MNGEIEYPARLNRGGKLAVVGALMLTLLLEALDATVVGTAMPRILQDLGGFDRYTWVITIYLVSSTLIIPLAGKLSDQFSRKWFLVGGTALFVAGSVLCSFASDIDQLIVFRAIQGIGGGVGLGLVSTAVADIFPPSERARWQGIVGSVYALASVFGPSLGGWLSDNGPLLWPVSIDDSRWRWVFLLNLPLGVIALLGLLFWLPADLGLVPGNLKQDAVKAIKRFDYAGTLLTFLATISLFIGLSQDGEAAFSWISLMWLGIAVLLFAALVVVERLATAPILPPDLFRNRTFTASVFLWVFQFMALLGMAFYVPLFIQKVLGASATGSGATMTPFSISIPLGGFLAGYLLGKLKFYRAMALTGSTFMTCGIFLVLLLTPNSTLPFVSVAVAIAGFGMGVLTPVVFTTAQNTLASDQLGVGTATLRYLGQLGGSVGVAVVGAIVNFSVAQGVTLDRAIIQGQWLVLAFCLGALVAAFLLKDTSG